MSGQTAQMAEGVRELVRAGDLGTAIAVLDEALAVDDDPELHLVSGELAYIGNDCEAASRHFQAAFGQFSESGRRRRAALAASWLGRTFFDGMGNALAGRVWLKRAARMIDDEPACVEQGWVALGLIGCAVADAGELEANAAVALDVARRFGDLSLEARALAETGLALVSLGKVEEAMPYLDEAIALATGDGVGPTIFFLVGCCVFTAFARAGDLERAEIWLRAVEDAGNLTSPVAVSHCSAVYGSLLCEVGRWSQAEQALSSAVEAGQRSPFFAQVNSRVAMADLRVKQGRLADAELLLFGLDDRIEALVPLARLRLARQDYDLAIAVARRGVRMLGSARTRTIPLLAVIADAALAGGDLESASAAAAQAVRLAATANQPALRAEASLAIARTRAAAGDVDDALSTLRRVLIDLGSAELPLQRAVMHVELATMQADTDRGEALSEARAARALYNRIGLPAPPALTVLFGRLEPATGAEPSSREAVLARDGRQWTVRHGSVTAVLRDTKGLRYLAHLLARQDVESHVFDLVDLVEGTPAAGEVDRRQLGHAGEILDATAKSAYRRRLEDLRGDLDDAQVYGDDDKAWRIQGEIDSIVAELGRAMGLDGRDRVAFSAAEKARLNVTRAIRTAINGIRHIRPELGEHLDATVRTGMFCSYVSVPDSDIRWDVQRGMNSAGAG